jgi:hypothetical protein
MTCLALFLTLSKGPKMLALTKMKKISFNFLYYGIWIIRVEYGEKQILQFKNIGLFS